MSGSIAPLLHCVGGTAALTPSLFPATIRVKLGGHCAAREAEESEGVYPHRDVYGLRARMDGEDWRDTLKGKFGNLLTLCR